MKPQPELEALFEKQFRDGMIDKDFKAFKKDFPTLYLVIISSLVELKERKENTISLLPIDKIYSELAEKIENLYCLGYSCDHLSIFCPDWYKQFIINNAEIYSFISKSEPLRFMGVELVSGYEDALIVSNSKAGNRPKELKKFRIEIINNQ